MAMTGLAGTAHGVSLRIAEAPLSWEVTIELKDMPAESFEVELADNKVHILLHDIAPVVLTFPQVIDPSSSSGDCGDGILRLSPRETGLPGARTGDSVKPALYVCESWQRVGPGWQIGGIRHE